MKKTFLVLVGIVFCFVFSVRNEIRAEESISDPQQVKEQPQEMSQDAQVKAKIEENQLREQIKAAIELGDLKTVQKLKQQLKAMRTENIEAMMNDGQETHSVEQDSNPPESKGGPGIN
jgi:hypothetical protein